MELIAQKREKFGNAVKSLRGEGFIPAEFYGHGMENEHISVKRDEFEKVLEEAGESTIVNLEVGGEKRPVLIYSIDRDPVSGVLRHVDFYGVRMDEKITTDVQLEFVGEAPGVKEKGGVLNKTITEIEVEALPANLPKSIQVDLKSLTDIDESIYVKDLNLPEGVECTLSLDNVVASITEPAPEEEELPTEQEAIEGVKVEGEDKKTEPELGGSEEKIEGKQEKSVAESKSEK